MCWFVGWLVVYYSYIIRRLDGGKLGVVVVEFSRASKKLIALPQ